MISCHPESAQGECTARRCETLAVDPLLAEWLRAALAFLFGAVIAAAARRWGFRDALELQNREHRQRDSGLRIALLAEVDENLKRIGERSDPSRISRTAWDAARAIRWPRRALEALAEAYADGERLNGWVAMTEAHLAASVAGDADAHSSHQGMLALFTLKLGERAGYSFLKARAELQQLEVSGAWRDPAKSRSR